MVFDAQYVFGPATRLQAQAVGEPGHRTFRLLVESVRLDGYLELPTGPGWGTEVNEEAVRAHPAKGSYPHSPGAAEAGTRPRA